MARMVLDRPVGLPAGTLGEALKGAFPDYRWQVGDGPPDGILPLDRPATIVGRDGDRMVMLGIELLPGTIDDPSAQPHAFHIRLTGPSTDDRAMAERMLAIVGGALAGQGGGALQLADDGPWLDAAALHARAGSLVPPPLDRDVPPPSSAADPTPTFPRGTGSDRPTFGRKKG